MKKLYLQAALLVFAAAATPAVAQEQIRIGLVEPLTDRKSVV